MSLLITIYAAVAIITFVGTVFINDDLGYDSGAAVLGFFVALLWPIFVFLGLLIFIGDQLFYPRKPFGPDRDID